MQRRRTAFEEPLGLREIRLEGSVYEFHPVQFLRLAKLFSIWHVELSSSPPRRFVEISISATGPVTATIGGLFLAKVCFSSFALLAVTILYACLVEGACENPSMITMSSWSLRRIWPRSPTLVSCSVFLNRASSFGATPTTIDAPALACLQVSLPWASNVNPSLCTCLTTPTRKPRPARCLVRYSTVVVLPDPLLPTT